MSISQAREYVRAGIALLDAHPDIVGEDWRTRVDWTTLNIGSSAQCVLAQIGRTLIDDDGEPLPWTAVGVLLFGEEEFYADRDPETGLMIDQAHGFLGSGGSGKAISAELTIAWQEACAPTVAVTA